MDSADLINLVRNKGSIEKYGWLGYNEIGNQGKHCYLLGYSTLQQSDTREIFTPQ